MEFGSYIFFTLAVHLLFFCSIFDIFLTSPVITGLEAVQPSALPPARRVVVFSADGLRHSTFISEDQEEKVRANFLLDRACNGGRYAISVTQIPTESRPGHVAMFGGFGEDVSAVMEGWTDNPVPFDTVLNQSTHSWAWGRLKHNYNYRGG